MSKQTNSTIKSEDVDFEALNNPELQVNKPEDTEANPLEVKPAEGKNVQENSEKVEAPKKETKTKVESKVESKSETKIEAEDEDSKTEEISEESEGIINTIFEGLQSSLNIEFSPEDLEGIELSEDLGTVNKLAELGANKLAEKKFMDFMNSHPDIQKAVAYIQANGSLQGIEEQTVYPDYSKADLTQEANQVKVYRDYLTAKGIEGEEAEDMITLAKDKGQLETKSKTAQQALVDYYSQLEQETTAKNAKTVQARQAEVAELKTQVSKAIDAGKILGLNLDAKERKAFQDYLLKPVDKQGRTAKEIYDETELSLEQELYLEYLKYKKFESVTPKVDKKVKTLKSLVEANKNRKVDIGGASEMTTGNFNTGNEIDWEALEKLPIGRKNK